MLFTSQRLAVTRRAKQTAENDLPPRYGQRLFVPGRREARRLAALESMCDPATISVLNHIGVHPGSRCLEIGAGRGSIARQLAGRVPDGVVIATEIEVGRLEKSRRSNLQVLRHDVTVDDFPDASFDLIHARFVLAHLSARESTLARMVGWLKPGGVLIVEGFSWDNVAGHDASFTAAMAAYDMLSARVIGTDSSWSQRIPESLADNGLELIDARTHHQTRMVRGGTPTATLWLLTLTQARKSAVNAGLATDEQFTQALRSLRDPSFVEIGPAMISSWGFRGHAKGPRR